MCAAVILIAGAFFEERFIGAEFREFSVCAEEVYAKTEDRSATVNDVYALQLKWLDVKSKLRAFISHNEIKEFDMWIAEACSLVGKELWEDALAKLEVVKELAEQIPKTFEISLSNVF